MAFNITSSVISESCLQTNDTKGKQKNKTPTKSTDDPKTANIYAETIQSKIKLQLAANQKRLKLEKKLEKVDTEIKNLNEEIRLLQQLVSIDERRRSSVSKLDLPKSSTSRSKTSRKLENNKISHHLAPSRELESSISAEASRHPAEKIETISAASDTKITNVYQNSGFNIRKRDLSDSETTRNRSPEINVPATKRVKTDKSSSNTRENSESSNSSNGINIAGCIEINLKDVFSMDDEITQPDCKDNSSQKKISRQRKRPRFLSLNPKFRNYVATCGDNGSVALHSLKHGLLQCEFASSSTNIGHRNLTHISDLSWHRNGNLLAIGYKEFDKQRGSYPAIREFKARDFVLKNSNGVSVGGGGTSSNENVNVNRSLITPTNNLSQSNDDLESEIGIIMISNDFRSKSSLNSDLLPTERKSFDFVTLSSSKYHYDGIEKCDWIKDSSRRDLITTSDKKLIHWNDMKTPSLLFNGAHSSVITSLSVSSDNDTVFTAGGSKIVQYTMQSCNTIVNKLEGVFCGSSGCYKSTRITDLKESPVDSNLLMVSMIPVSNKLLPDSNGHIIRIYDKRIGFDKESYINEMRRPSVKVSSLVFPSWTSDGLYITCGGKFDGDLHLFDTRHDVPRRKYKLTINRNRKAVTTACWRGKSDCFTISDDCKLKYFNINGI